MTLDELRAELTKLVDEYGVPGDTKVSLVVDTDAATYRDDLDSVDWQRFYTHEAQVILATKYR